MKDLLSNISVSGKTKSIYKVKTSELYTVKTQSRCKQVCILKQREEKKEELLLLLVKSRHIVLSQEETFLSLISNSRPT